MLDASTPDIAGIYFFIKIQPSIFISNTNVYFKNAGKQNLTLSKDKSVIVDNNKFSWPVDDNVRSQNVNGK